MFQLLVTAAGLQLVANVRVAKAVQIAFAGHHRLKAGDVILAARFEAQGQRAKHDSTETIRWLNLVRSRLANFTACSPGWGSDNPIGAVAHRVFHLTHTNSASDCRHPLGCGQCPR